MPQMLVGPYAVVQMMLNLKAKQPDETVEKILATPDLDSIISYILSGKCKNIITMAGAGISTCKPHLPLICNLAFHAFWNQCSLSFQFQRPHFLKYRPTLVHHS